MTTPLLMLALMVAPYALARAWSLLRARPVDRRAAGALGLALLFAFTAVGHFVQTEAMAGMLPEWVPARVTLVQVTGVLELALAAGFAVRRTRRAAGLAAAALLVLFFPVNVHAALERVPMGGHAWGPVYLWIRGPLQLAILAWTWAFALRRDEGEG